MAAHKADEILDRVVELLSHLDTTAERVVAERTYTVDDGELPALSVYMGAEELQDDNVVHADELLEIIVQIHVAEHEPDQADSTADNVRRTILKIAREVWVAIHADHTLGKSFIERTWIAGRSQPVIDAEATRPTAVCEVLLRVKYRHDYADPATFT